MLLETYDLLIKHNKDYLEKLEGDLLKSELDRLKALSILKEELNLNEKELLELNYYNSLKA